MDVQTRSGDALVADASTLRAMLRRKALSKNQAVSDRHAAGTYLCPINFAPKKSCDDFAAIFARKCRIKWTSKLLGLAS